MTPPIAAAAQPVPDPLAVLDDPVELQRFTRTEPDAQGRPQALSALRIHGMHCAACAGLIEAAVSRVPGVLAISVNAAGERAQLRWDPSRTRMADLVAAIRAAGYDAVPDVARDAREARRRDQRTALWRLFVAAFCAMQVMMMATPSYVAHGGELAPDLRQLLNWGSWLLTLPVMAFAAGPFFSGAWRSLRQRRIGMDVPVALGIAVTFVASSGATFDPAGPFGREVYFDSLTMFISFLLAGRWLEARARHRVAQSLEDALEGLPATAWRLDAQGLAETVSVQRLRPGDRVRVPLGQAFPADGHIVRGSTRADESLLTGESAPVAKACGDAVVGGSLNLGAPVEVLLERTGLDTRLEGIVALMRDAMTQRPALARRADRWAGPFLWGVLALALGGFAAWQVLDPARALWVAVSVLIVTCPCALSLAAPSALLSATGALARQGVMLQRLDALDTLTRVQRVYLDKTGTVTDERLQCLGLRLLGPSAWDDAALMQRAVALAGWSSHPLSQALVASQRAIDASGASVAIASPPPAADGPVTEQPGQGLQALDAAGRSWRLGAAAWAWAAAADPDSEASADAGPAIWLGCDGRALARIDFDESLRPDAVATVAALRADGIEVVLLSGDRPDRARRMGRRLAVDAVIGGATPQDKLDAVRAAQAEGRVVAMVGDGLNDAPVLALADVSMAMGQGALVARAQADAILASGRLGDVVLMRRLALRTLRVVRQNMAWALAYNLVCIPLALRGWLPPWAAGLGMASSSLLVIANALRLAR